MKVKKIITSAALVCISYFAVGQTEGVSIKPSVGPPDESAMLDVENSGKGVLIPRVKLSARTSPDPVSNPEPSLLVYNLLDSGTWPDDVHPGFYYWDGNEWRRMIDEEPDYSNGGIIGIGGIIMWSGDTNPLNLPYGWQLCDGSAIPSSSPLRATQATTPDLRGMFVASYSLSLTPTDYSPIGRTGGVNSVAFNDPSNLPSHNHNGNAKIAGKIGLQGNTEPAGGHNHTVNTYNKRQKSKDGMGDRTDQKRPGGIRSTTDIPSYVATSTIGDHTHTLDGMYTISGNPTVAVHPDGSGAAIDNRPPYYVLAYLIRIF